MGQGFKDFFLHQLSVRMIYIAAAFGTSHLVALASSEKFLAIQSKAGFAFHINDPDVFKTWLTGLLLAGGEIVFFWLHKKAILPIVNPKEPASLPPTA